MTNQHWIGNNIGQPIINGVVPTELQSAIASVLSASQKAGKKCGIFATSASQAKAFADQGYDMISLSTDYSAMQSSMVEQLRIAKGSS